MPNRIRGTFTSALAELSASPSYTSLVYEYSIAEWEEAAVEELLCKI